MNSTYTSHKDYFLLYSLPVGALVGEEGDGVSSVGTADVGYGSLLNRVGTLGFRTEIHSVKNLATLYYNVNSAASLPHLGSCSRCVRCGLCPCRAGRASPAT